MTRGTFANIRLRNFLVEQEGGYTKHLPTGETMAIYDASMRYQKDGAPLCVLAGKEYGTGSSRDWAAKGTFLLGVKFVLAESYERIHRSNLVGMGVLPLQYLDGQNRESLGLSGYETFDVAVDDSVQPRQRLTVTATSPEGAVKTFEVQCRIDTPVEVDYFRNGGILQTVIRKLLPPVKKAKAGKKAAAKAAPKKAPAKKSPAAKAPTKKRSRARPSPWRRRLRPARRLSRRSRRRSRSQRSPPRRPPAVANANALSSRRLACQGHAGAWSSLAAQWADRGLVPNRARSAILQTRAARNRYEPVRWPARAKPGRGRPWFVAFGGPS
jgi:3-isopropylmalate dehydratase small subunit